MRVFPAAVNRSFVPLLGGNVFFGKLNGELNGELNGGFNGQFNGKFNGEFNGKFNGEFNGGFHGDFNAELNGTFKDLLVIDGKKSSHNLHQICNRNSVKVSYSGTANVAAKLDEIIKSNSKTFSKCQKNPQKTATAKLGLTAPSRTLQNNLPYLQM